MRSFRLYTRTELYSDFNFMEYFSVQISNYLAINLTHYAEIAMRRVC